METMKRWLSIGLSIIVGIAVFAGCGRNTGRQEDFTGRNAPVEAMQRKIKLVLWDYLDYDKQLVERFSEKYPNIEVEVTNIPNQEYDNKLTVMLASGEEMDVFYVRTLAVYANLVLQRNLKPVDDLIKNDVFDRNAYGKILDDIRIDGKLYCLPYRSDIFIVVYNKDIFDKANVPYPSSNWTWDDFRDIANKLASGHGNSKVYGAQNVAIPTPGCYTIPGTQKQKSSDLVTGDLAILKPAFEFFLDMEQVDKSAMDYGTSKSLNADQVFFEKGTVGMQINGTWMLNILTNDKKAGKFDFNWGIAKLPRWTDGEDQTRLALTPACINSKTAKPDEAWTFVKFAAGVDGAGILAQNLMMPAYIDDEILNIFNHHPDLPKGSSDVLKRDKVYLDMASHKAMGLVQNMINQETELIMTKNKTVDQGIADMMKRRQEIIEKIK